MALISDTDVELELQTSLPAGYTTAFIETLSDTAESIVQNATNRTSFTGGAADLYSRVVLCWIVNSLVSPNPSLMKGSVTQIKEGDSQITFGNGRGVSTYAVEYSALIETLKIRTSGTNYTYTNESTFYSEEDSE
ncbi:hypothetical protein [Methanolobus psychrotolerans]|uniref:hypothetical protein n=1 Tax=Methanolobus psychrotolerans TaxID=1874706 RepID=UPI000B91C28C|nr:hypothetical protein [Methanolobus psychrotolerans]